MKNSTKLIAVALTAVAFSTNVVASEKAFSLPKGDAASGEVISKKCTLCHKFGKDEGNSTGPNLWGIVDRDIASIEDFKYSKGFEKKKAEGLVWNEENISHFLENPRKFIKRNKMTFAGLRKEQDRADLIEWLKTLKDEK